ncbi:thiolase family protein [Pseudomonas sp. NPDC096950]|uniref:thiolase family protein n=1 Tax=Pseudomonas sp. NPDC096950 TaxID=3364485 RepID=UPI00383B81EF
MRDAIVRSSMHRRRKGSFEAFDDVALLSAVRTPWSDLGGPLAKVSPTDLGIKVARTVLARSAMDPAAVDAVIAGSVAQSSFDAYFMPRHIGLYSGVPVAVPALQVQRICATGLEILHQAAERIDRDDADMVLCVASESMSRNPIAAYTHRGGFSLGEPVQFKDFLWEALFDPAIGINMIETAETLAQQYTISRQDVDEWAHLSFARAMAAQEQGWFDDELVTVQSERFEQDGYCTRSIALPRKVAKVSRDTHIRHSSLETLAALPTLSACGVQTAGNSCAVVDGAAAMLVARASHFREMPLLAMLRASAVVGVEPELMGLGPVQAIRLLLERTGLSLDDIDLFEINEAQGAQVLAVQRELGLDPRRLNVCGGAIAMGHPLAATGLRLAMTLGRQLKQSGLRFGIASVCVGGGQGMALLLESPTFTRTRRTPHH